MIFALEFRPEHNFTLMSKFDRIIHQVKNDLAESPGVALHEFRYVGRKITGKLEPPFIGLGGDCLQSFFRTIQRIKGDGLEFDLACFNLGVVKDVVDHPKQRIGRYLDGFQIV